jgi:DNA gyrase inhibitor GyrI
MKINGIEVKTLEPIDTIALTHKGPYSGMGAAFQKIAAWAQENNYWAKGPRMLGVYHNNPADTPESELLSSACLEDMGGMEPGAEMERYRISGGKYIVMSAEVRMAEYGEAWEKAYAAIAERGLEDDVARDHYELYIGSADSNAQCDDAPWIIDFCIPVKLGEAPDSGAICARKMSSRTRERRQS